MNLWYVPVVLKVRFFKIRLGHFYWNTTPCRNFPLVSQISFVIAHFLKTKWPCPELVKKHIRQQYFDLSCVSCSLMSALCPLPTQSFSMCQLSFCGLKLTVFSVMLILLMLASGLIIARETFTLIDL